MREHGQPNPVVNAMSKAVAAMRADDDMMEVAKAHEELGARAIEQLTPEEARREPTPADAVKRVLQKQGRDTSPESLVPGVSRRDLSIPGPGGDLHAFLYTPEGAGPHPVIVYFHGGGWVIADAEVYDGGARSLSQAANAIVLSVDYRQAPEHPFPAAWDDAIAAYAWAAQNAREFGGDPSRLALAGESAGGGLAVATAVAARDAGLPAPRHVLSVYPIAQTESFNTESYIENAIAKPLNRAMMEWFLDHAIPNEQDRADPRANVVKADLRGLPPVTIINATLDPLRSDGGMLEDALEAAGVRVEREIYTGVTHEFFGCGAVVAKAKEAVAFAGQRLQADLRR